MDVITAAREIAADAMRERRQDARHTLTDFDVETFGLCQADLGNIQEYERVSRSDGGCVCSSVTVRSPSQDRRGYIQRRRGIRCRSDQADRTRHARPGRLRAREAKCDLAPVSFALAHCRTCLFPSSSNVTGGKPRWARNSFPRARACS